MRNLDSVEVTKAIVHILELKGGRKVISDADIPLESNPELKKYIADLILAASKEPLAKAAKFPEDDHQNRSSFYLAMFKDDEDDSAFVPNSKVLANQFYKLMEQDKRIADGDLVVCNFTTDQLPQTKFMAIMKLDPMGAFKNVELTTLKSGTIVELRKDPYIFSENPDALQKGAFFGLPEEGEGSKPDLLLLDKQLNRGEIARFFFQDLLGVALLEDSAELTLRLYKCLIEGLNILRPFLPVSKERHLGEKIYGIFSQDSDFSKEFSGVFSKEKWLKTLTVSNYVETTLRKIMDERLPGIKKFQLDFMFVQEFTRRRTFSGEVQSKFSIPTRDYRNVVRSVEYVTPPGDDPYYEVIIHTTKWREEV